MNAQRWFIVLSPDGAARTVGIRVVEAFKEHLGADNFKIFDTLTYREAYHKLLATPSHDITADLLNQSLTVSCLDFQATHCLVLALCPVTLFTLSLLRKYGVVTVHWFYEDYRRTHYWKEVLAGYAHFCAIQRGPLPEACERAGAVFHLLPNAGLLSGDMPDAVRHEREYDVAFIGIPSAYRIAVLERLASAAINLRLAIAGSGWKSYCGILQKYILNSQWTSEAESYGILSNAKIGINLSVDEPRERDLVHISPRAYDVLAAGALLVSEEAPLLRESLSGCTYRTFGSADEAYAAVKDLLSTYETASAVAETNRLTVLRDHTYAKRVEELLTFTA